MENYIGVFKPLLLEPKDPHITAVAGPRFVDLLIERNTVCAADKV